MNHHYSKAISWLVFLPIWMFQPAFLSPVFTQAGCFAPFLENTSSGLDSAAIRWRDPLNNMPAGYEIEWVLAGTPPSGIPDTLVNGDQVRFVLRGLDSGLSLWFFIRTVCSPGNSSDWNGPYLVVTDLENPSRCGMDLEIEQENCQSPQVFPVHVTGFPGGILGTTHMVRSVSLIIEHTWPEDLTIRLRAPNGTEVTLIDKKGRISDHFGDPQDSLCNRVTILDPFSCRLLNDNSPPYIGSFQPDGDLLTFLDGGNVNGIWELSICDDLPTDVGKLKFFSINFEPVECLPLQISPADSITESSVVIRWEPIRGTCDSVTIEYGPTGFTPGTGTRVEASCSPMQIRISGLSPSSSYEAYVYQNCDSVQSQTSCPVSWETACAATSLIENFDEQDLCGDDCGVSCILSGVWTNGSDDDMDWLSHRGATLTSRTGPDQDISGIGNYIYIETSDIACQRGKQAILYSSCLVFDGFGSACHFSFYYHMFGRDMGSLQLEISLDNENSWTSLWNATGDQGDIWRQVFIDLSEYKGKIGKLRFVGIGGTGQRSDIALDELRFYGSVSPTSDQVTYFRDEDMDGYGNPQVSILFCGSTMPAGYVSNPNDCDDSNPLINPGMPEIPCNLIDENCNGDQDDRQQNTLEILVIDQGNASCQGATDGFIHVQGSGGTEPYRYEWLNGQFPDTNLLTGLGAGFYQCIVSDEAGCRTQSDFIEVKETTILNYAVTRTDRPQCSGFSDGAIYIEVTGGVEPYSYEWSNGDTTKDLRNVPPGTYWVMVSDANGCNIRSAPIEILPFEMLRLATISNKSPDCHSGSNGLIELRGSGGNPPYKYRWNTGDTTARISQLKAGTYQCTMTDANGCLIVSRQITLDDPLPIEIILNGLDMASCPGGSDGAIRIRVSGGTAPYFYQWTGGSFQQDQFNLRAGTYQVTVTDFNGCTARSRPFVVTEPDDLTFIVDSLKHVSCPLSKDGHISVEVTGGSEPYSYFWSNGERDTQTISSLDPGTYRLTITDDLGCKYVSDDVRVELANIPLTLQMAVVDSIQCHGTPEGRIQVNVLNGSPGFRYNWSTGIENSRTGRMDTLGSLLSGTYSVTVTDELGCTGTSEFVRLSQPDELSHELLELRDPSCSGFQDGSIEVNIKGGTPPFEFLWSTGSTNRRIGQLGAGNYTLEVTDRNKCTFRSPVFTLKDPEPLGLIAQVKGTTTGSNQGEIHITPFGGVPPYSLLWDPRIQTFTGFKAQELFAGTYQATLFDSVACQLDTSITVPVLQSIHPKELRLEYINAFPNPSSEQITIELRDEKGLCLDISLLDSQGKLIQWLGTISCLKEWSSNVSIQHLTAGKYYFFISTQNGRSTLLPFVKIP